MDECLSPAFARKFYRIAVSPDGKDYKNEIVDELLVFIGTYCHVSLPYRNKIIIGQEIFNTARSKNEKLAHAYRAIKIETNKILDVGIFSPQKTSNKEIQSIRKYYERRFCFFSKKEIILKIPYKVMCIFWAIKTLLSEIERIMNVKPSISGKYEKLYEKQIRDFRGYVSLLDMNNIEDFDKENIRKFENIFSAPSYIFQSYI